MAVEVTFDSLEKLGATVWGQALQLTAAEADGALKLTCEDPARFAVNATILREMRRDGVSSRRRVEYQAMIDMLSTGMKGVKLRTVINLPAPALSAEGASLSQDRKRLTYETAIGDEADAVNTWLAKPPAAVGKRGVYALPRISSPLRVDAEGEKGRVDRRSRLYGFAR